MSAGRLPTGHRPGRLKISEGQADVGVGKGVLLK